MTWRVGWIVVVGWGLLAFVPSSSTFAQQEAVFEAAQVNTPASGPATTRPGGSPPVKAGQSPGGKPGAKANPNGAKPDTKADGKPAKEESKGAETVKRPTEPPKPPDESELEVRPDEDGKVRFSFIGQPWPDVLQWLAEISHMSLDWQEVPGGFLNLTTERAYTVDETRDLINLHLFVRGYTLLRNGEILSVVNIEKLDSGMVPRVAPDDLDKRDPHEIVKVSFALDWLLAEEAVAELQPMVSPHGKLTALKSTNRLEAIDAVTNLLELRHVLEQEQSGDSQDRLMREFVLKYVRADEAHKLLQGLLGIEQKEDKPLTPQEIQMQQQQAQMRAQQQQKNPNAGQEKEPPKVYLVVNQRKNSILANAPPDRMALVEQAIATLDVPSDTTSTLLMNPGRMQMYRLAGIDPETLVTMLHDLGDLDPMTQLHVDKKNNAIIAHASLADHLTIRQVVERLDGSSRSFEVIRLRRLDAEYVAGTIEFMMGSAEEDSRPSRDSYYGYYSYGRSSSSTEKEEGNGKFRVDADIENNKLLLWANEIELAEVENLLAKLGEIPTRGGNPDTVRVIDSTPRGEELQELFERLQRIWEPRRANPLQLDAVPEPSETESASPQNTTLRDAPTRAPSPDLNQTALLETRNVREDDRPAAVLSPGVRTTGDVAFRVVAQLPPPDRSESESRRSPSDTGRKAPPVTITVAPDGRLVITSDDTEALDLMEEILGQVAPRRSEFALFRLRYAWAVSVALNLEDVFGEEKKESGSRYPYYYYYDYDSSRNDTKERSRLSSRPPVKFVSDIDSNSILVQNADPRQLDQIKDLIEFYDQPPPTDSQSVRRNKIYPIHYSKASVIADSIKDVYRDLLSANDKALVNNQQQQQAPKESYTFVYGDSGEDGSEQKMPKFKGQLSIGVDEVSNTLVVSAPQYLLDEIEPMIRELDEAAKPLDAVQVVKMGRNVNAAHLQETLAKILAARQQGAGKQNGQPGQQPAGQGAGQQQGGAQPAAVVAE